MAGTMANVLLLVFSITFILLTLAALNRTRTLLFSNPSRQDVRDLLVALEDLLLPMGSFPSELLRRWAPTVPNENSIPTTPPFPTVLSPDDTGSCHHGESFSSKPNPGDDQIEVPTAIIPTESTPHNGRPKPTVIVSSALPIPNDNGPEQDETEQQENNVATVEEVPTESQAFENALRELVDRKGKLGPDLHKLVELVADKLKRGSEAEEKLKVETENFRVPTESQEFEKALRELVDPKGKLGPDLHKLAELVADKLKRGTKAEEKLKVETENLRRVKEDQEHERMDKKAVFERITNGQNAMVQFTKRQNSELATENTRLRNEASDALRKRTLLKERYNDRLQSLAAAKELAEQDKETAEEEKKAAISEVDGRIDAQRETHDKEKCDVENERNYERNSLLCKNNITRDSLLEAQSQLREAEKQHRTTIKNKDSTIDQLRLSVRELEPGVIAAEELAALDKQHLKKQLEDQRKQKDGEIGTLKDELRESNGRIRELSEWKSRAEGEKRIDKRMVERIQEEKTTIRENNQYIVDKRNLEIGSLRRNVKTHEASISKLEEKVTSLESGEEMRSLTVQLEKSQKQLLQSSRKKRGVEQQLQTCKLETEKLQNDIKARDQTITDEAKKTSEAKDALKKQLEEAARISKEGFEEKVRRVEQQNNELSRKLKSAHHEAKKTSESNDALKKQVEEAARVSNKGFEEKARKLEQQNKDLSRKLETSHSDEQKSRTNIQRVEEEKQRMVTEYEKSIREKDGEIGRLGTLVQDAQDALETRTKEAGQAVIKFERDYKEKQKKAVEDAVRKAIGEAKGKVGDNERYKEAVESAARETADANNANDLLLEIGKCGAARGSAENQLLCKLIDVKLALHKVKRDLQEPDVAAHKNYLVGHVHDVDVDERLIQQVRNDTHLVQQTLLAKARVQNVQKALSKDGFQKDAILEALNNPNPFERETRKPRGIRRSAQPGSSVIPSSAPRSGHGENTIGQSQQTNEVLEQQNDPQSKTATSQDRMQGLTQTQSRTPVNKTAISQDRMQGLTQTKSSTPVNGSNTQPEPKVVSDVEPMQGISTASDKPPSRPLVIVNARKGNPSKSKKFTPFADLLSSLKPPKPSDQAETTAIPKPAVEDNNSSSKTPAAKAQSSLPSPQSDLEAPVSPDTRPKRKMRSRIRPLAQQGQRPGSQAQVVNAQQGGSSSSSQHEDRSKPPQNWTVDMTKFATDMIQEGDDIAFVEETTREMYNISEDDTKGWDTWLEELQSNYEAGKKGEMQKDWSQVRTKSPPKV